ncbi:MAG: RecX family transcriptional regulator [Bacteroidales bacterium]|nr:RecX family transcriptional regulator [Bacteroidales bacterium]
MKRWGLSDKEIEAPLARLRTEGFIDDVRYTQSFVNDKFTFNKWGRIKIAFMLRQEKIPEAVVNAALEEIDEAVYFTALLSLIREKRKTVRAGNARELHDKLYRYAQGRGFESELINVALKMLL